MNYPDIPARVSTPHEALQTAVLRRISSSLLLSERVQVNPDNSRAKTALTLTFIILKLDTLQKRIVQLGVSRSHDVNGVLNLQNGYCTTIKTSWR